jgi:hypothetical protein
MTTHYCPRCPPDMNGSRRSLLLELGTKCHGCGYTATPDLLAVVLDNLVGCYVAEHGAVPKHDQLELRRELRAALDNDMLNDSSLSPSFWTRAHVEEMVMGADDGGPSAMMTTMWPRTNEVIFNWSV